ncbi:YciI family protein [Vibrio rarus]|uniref:YciI family protein n=1 Tax=Vibrio rarus TaxID=413403 RepID=UPI0021C28B97|nr:YciI family protein [Vibrio rarus]
MIKWNDYKAQAKDRGSLAMEVYMIESTVIASPSEVGRHLPDHLAYQAKLEQAGILMFAGPLSDETGEMMTGSGLIIYRTRSLESAKALAEEDPMHKKGVRAFRIRRWLINEGSLQLNVKLSAQQVDFDPTNQSD